MIFFSPTVFFYVTFIRQKTFRPLRNGFLSGWWELLYLGTLALEQFGETQVMNAHTTSEKKIPVGNVVGEFSPSFFLHDFLHDKLVNIRIFCVKNTQFLFMIDRGRGGELLSDTNRDNKPYCLVKRNAGKAT